MNKERFADILRSGLTGLPQSEIDRYVEYYLEMINDRIDEGMTEEEAVQAVGNPEDIAAQIRKERGVGATVTGEVQRFADKLKNAVGYKGKLEPWHILVIILIIVFIVPVGVPVIGVGFAGISVIFAVAAAVFGVLIAIFAALLGIMAAGVGLCVTSIFLMADGLVFKGLFMLGAGLFMTGIASLLWRAAISLVELIVSAIKKGVNSISSKIRERRAKS